MFLYGELLGEPVDLMEVAPDPITLDQVYRFIRVTQQQQQHGSADIKASLGGCGGGSPQPPTSKRHGGGVLGCPTPC